MAYCYGCRIPVLSSMLDPNQPKEPYCEKCKYIIEKAKLEFYDSPERYPEERQEDIEERYKAKEKNFLGMLCTKCTEFVTQKLPGRIPTFYCEKCDLVWEYSNLQGFWSSTKVDKTEVLHMILTMKAMKGETVDVATAQDFLHG